MVCFFFMLNFLLAIIVDAYASVMERVRSSDAEMDLVHDTLWLLKRAFHGVINKWPAQFRILDHVEYHKDVSRKEFIHVEHLYMEGVDLFRSEQSAASWVDFYMAFKPVTHPVAGEDQEEEPPDSMTSQSRSIGHLFRKLDLGNRELLSQIRSLSERMQPVPRMPERLNRELLSQVCSQIWSLSERMQPGSRMPERLNGELLSQVCSLSERTR